jgi:hypothetical protein
MPLIRDDEEERLTRIEHVLEQLQHQRDGARDHELPRIQAATVREALRSATQRSRAARLERARTAQPSKSKKR